MVSSLRKVTTGIRLSRSYIDVRTATSWSLRLIDIHLLGEAVQSVFLS
jgi:hypothetical protein